MVFFSFPLPRTVPFYSKWSVHSLFHFKGLLLVISQTKGLSYTHHSLQNNHPHTLIHLLALMSVDYLSLCKFHYQGLYLSFASSTVSFGIYL